MKKKSQQTTFALCGSCGQTESKWANFLTAQTKPGKIGVRRRVCVFVYLCVRKCDVGYLGWKYKQREEQLVKPKRDREGKKKEENEIIVWCVSSLFFPLPSFGGRASVCIFIIFGPVQLISVLRWTGIWWDWSVPAVPRPPKPTFATVTGAAQS